MLWFVAQQLHLKYLFNEDEQQMKEYKEEIALLETKIQVAENKLNTIQNKKARIVDMFIEGLLDKNDKNDRIEKIKLETINMEKELVSYKEQKDRLNSLINGTGKKEEFEKYMSAMDMVDDNNIDFDFKYEIVHTHIKSVHIEREGYNNKVGYHIYIYAITGQCFEFMYCPYAKNDKITIIDKGNYQLLS